MDSRDEKKIVEVMTNLLWVEYGVNSLISEAPCPVMRRMWVVIVQLNLSFTALSKIRV